jgi:Fe-S-cluster containining protein
MQARKLTQKQRLCIACRKCCEAVGVYIDPDIYNSPVKDLIHFYKARGFSVAREDGLLFLVLDFPCPHLKKTGCAIYHKRPKICRTYSGLEDFGGECLWATLPEHQKKGKRG